MQNVELPPLHNSAAMGILAGISRKGVANRCGVFPRASNLDISVIIITTSARPVPGPGRRISPRGARALYSLPTYTDRDLAFLDTVGLSGVP